MSEANASIIMNLMEVDDGGGGETLLISLTGILGLTNKFPENLYVYFPQ